MYATPFYNKKDENSIRGSSAPFITGDTFRFYADYIFDEDSLFIPSQVKACQIIFVKGVYLKLFFSFYHPRISVPYVLITHNTDISLPGPYALYLQDAKILYWFTQNIDRNHPKLYPIPIGIANSPWSHGQTTIWLEKMKMPKKRRSKLLLMNFLIDSFPQQRKKVYDLFQKKSFCSKERAKDFTSYLDDLLDSKFVLSPRGQGLDCHRTWEVLMMGAYPIVRSSSLDVLYKDLPVVIIKDWKEITRSFLEKTYLVMQKKIYNYEKLKINYWLEKQKSLIESSQANSKKLF